MIQTSRTGWVNCPFQWLFIPPAWEGAQDLKLKQLHPSTGNLMLAEVSPTHNTPIGTSCRDKANSNGGCWMLFFFHLTTLIFYSWPFFPHLPQNYKQHLNQILHDRCFLQGFELPYFSTHFQKSCTKGVYLSGSHCTDLKINATELWGQQIWMYPISFNFKPWI